MQKHPCTVWKSIIAGIVIAGAGAYSNADITPDWETLIPSSASLNLRYADSVTSSDGTSYLLSGISFIDDIGVHRVNADGTVGWFSRYAGPLEQDVPAGIAMSWDEQFVYALGRSSVPGFGDADYVIIKYDAHSGDELWRRFIDGGDTGIDNPMAIAGTPDGGVVATGGFDTPDEQRDIGTVKLSSDGDEIWRRYYTGVGPFLFENDDGDEIVVTPEGHVIVSGGAKAGSSSNDIFTIKYDGDTGSTIWVNQYGTSANESVRDLILASNGDAIAYISGPFGLDRQWVVLRIDGETGDQRWVTLVDPGQDEFFGSITEGPDGVIYATGATDPDSDDSNNNENLITIAYDGESGVVLWLRAFGENGIGDSEFGAALRVGTDGRLYVFGYTNADDLTGQMFDTDVLVLAYDTENGDVVDMSVLEFSEPSSEDGDVVYAAGLDDMGRIYAFGVANSTDLLATRFSFGSACPVDLNRDGTLDFFDVSAFLNAYNAMDPVADFDGDGEFSFFDVSSFLNQFNAGCP
jgi:hypothetical protein